MRFEGLRGGGGGGGRGLFLSVSFSINGTEGDGDEGYVRESGQVLGQNGIKKSTEEEEAAVVFAEDRRDTVQKGSGAMNTTKHLWSGAVAAMVSRLPFYLTKPPHFIANFSFLVIKHLYLLVTWVRSRNLSLRNETEIGVFVFSYG